MITNSFVLKGDLCWSRDRRTLNGVRDGYLVCVDGISAGVYDVLPEAYRDLPLEDHTGRLVIPGLTDLHVHAPQYAFRGLGMDLELLDWLEVRVFPEEAKYADPDYARRAYAGFVDAMRRGPNTRACVFATVHSGATRLLMELFEASGLDVMVGKVNMDRNCPDALREANAAASLARTEQLLRETAGAFRRVRPILTPRFIPSCTDALLEGLGALQKTHGLAVQSHLSENEGEVAWVRTLCPAASCYGDAYDRFGLFGSGGPVIMAHCVLSTDEEIALMKARGVWVAHCPQSNTNLSSGIAPVRRYLDEGLRIGLGSDVAGGSALSILRAMADAVQCSKLRWRLQDRALRPITVPEAFWMGTVGGGSFFGKVGSFDPGYALDAVVLKEDTWSTPLALTIQERLERAVYLSGEQDVVKKFVGGAALW